MSIFVLTEYEYDTYSFSGRSPCSMQYFRTQEAAMDWAAAHGLQVVLPWEINLDTGVDQCSIVEEPLLG